MSTSKDIIMYVLQNHVCQAPWFLQEPPKRGHRSEQYSNPILEYSIRLYPRYWPLLHKRTTLTSVVAAGHLSSGREVDHTHTGFVLFLEINLAFLNISIYTSSLNSFLLEFRSSTAKRKFPVTASSTQLSRMMAQCGGGARQAASSGG